MFDYRIVLGAVAILTSATVYAETESTAPVWKGSVALGMVSTSGNTDTQTIKSKAKVELDQIKWRHAIAFESLTSSDEDVRTAERYILNGQSDYKIGKKSYLFFMINYEDDQFSGYDYRVTEALGYGRRVVDWVSLKLDLEIGPGARQSELETGGNEDEGMLRGAAKLEWKISDNASLTEDLSTDIGEDSTISKSVTALTTKINGSLASKLTFTFKNTTDVPDGVKNNDTETAVTLIYSF